MDRHTLGGVAGCFALLLALTVGSTANAATPADRVAAAVEDVTSATAVR